MSKNVTRQNSLKLFALFRKTTAHTFYLANFPAKINIFFKCPASISVIIKNKIRVQLPHTDCDSRTSNCSIYFLTIDNLQLWSRQMLKNSDLC